MADTVKIAVEASLKNAQEITRQIKEAVEKSLADIDLKTLDKLANRISQAFELLNNGLVNDARKAAQSLNVDMLKMYNNINVAAGDASNEVSELVQQLNDAQKQLSKFEKEFHDKDRFRRRPKSGEVVYTKEGLSTTQLKAIGQPGQNGLARINGHAIDFGAKWSVPNAAYAIGDELRVALQKTGAERDDSYIKALTDALTAIGFQLKNDKIVIDPAVAAKLAEAEKAYEDESQRLAKVVEELQARVHEEAQNSGAPVVSSEEGSFTTAQMQQTTIYNQKNINDALAEEARATKEANEARKQHNDAQEEAAERQAELAHETDKGTVAQQKQTNAVSKAITTFFGYQMIIRQLRRLWREAIHTITELDKQLTTQAMVTGMTREQTWQLAESYQKIAQATGLAQTTIAGVTTEYLRQGESLENALTLTKAAAAAATVAGISASDSVQYLTTAIHGFKLEAEDALAVSDKFAALAASAATNYEDLAVALSKVASQAALAGMSMDYTLALLTTGLDVTQEAPESIGTALKTVIARMREISDYGKTLEDDVDINQVEAGLHAVGIELKDGVGELRSTEEVLDELGKKWNTLTANQQAAVAKALAGTRQQSRLVAIMENYNKVIEYQNTAMTSIGATTAQQVTYLEGMEAAVNNLQSTYQSLIKSLISSQEAINLVTTIRNVLKWVGNFLKQPAGRWALLAGVVSVLTRSKELMDRIKNTVDQLIRSLSNLRKENEQILRQQETALQQAQNELAIKQKGATISSASRPNGWLSNVAAQSTATDVSASLVSSVLKTLIKLPTLITGAGRQSVKNDWGSTHDTIKSWYRNNSFLAKWRSRKADKATINAGIAKLQTQQQTPETEKQLNVLANKRLAIEDKIAYLAKGELINKNEEAIQTKQNTIEANKQTIEAKLQQMNETSKSDEEKKQLEAEIKATEEVNKQLDTDVKATEEANKQLKLERQQTEEDAKQGGNSKKLGTKMSGLMQKVSGAVAAVSTAIAWGQEIMDIIQNYGKQLGAEALESSKRVQAEMYQNTQLKSTIASSSATIKKLSSQVVKTTEDMQALDEAQTEFAEALGLSKEEVASMSSQQIDDLAQAKQQALDEKNQKLAEELNDTLTKASYNRSGWEIAGNIIGKTGAGAAAGGMVGNWVGALVGGVAGLITGVVEEGIRAGIANDAKNKINALLETDEGVEQFKYALKLNYRTITEATNNGTKEMSQALSTMFSSIVELFDADDLKKILEKYDYNMAAFAQHFNELLSGNSDAVKILSSEDATIKQRVDAAVLIDRLTQSDAEINAAFKKINSRYLEINQSFEGIADVLEYISDKTDWSISHLSEVINAFGTDTEGFQTTIANLTEWIKEGATDTALLAETVKDLTKEELQAIKDMVTGGRSLQDVADTNTRNRSRVASFRETQANWSNMTESDQQRFIDENIEFFSNPEARRKFFNGEDITKELQEYQAKIQEESRKLYEEQRQAALLELAKARESGDAAWQAQAEAYLAMIEDRIESVDHMFDLSLKDIVDKQQEQISKLKEMYQAEEEALTKSLQKRKEAYQKYFDGLAKAESLAEYNQNREDLVNAIARVGAGTDANSRRKVADLQRQLRELDKQEAQRQKEEARQAVLENIDSEIQRIQDKFDELLKSDQALLDSMDQNTYFQYLAYLAQSGQTKEAQDLAIREMGDLLKGKWGTKGNQLFSAVAANVAAETTTPTVSETQVDTSSNTFTIMNTSGEEQRIQLTEQQMRQLVSQLLDTVNRWTGTSYKAK